MGGQNHGSVNCLVSSFLFILFSSTNQSFGGFRIAQLAPEFVQVHTHKKCAKCYAIVLYGALLFLMAWCPCES